MGPSNEIRARILTPDPARTAEEPDHQVGRYAELHPDMRHRVAGHVRGLPFSSEGATPPAFRQVVIDRDASRFRAFVRRTARSGEITVDELIAFMHDFGLRFGVAQRPAERQIILRLRDRLSALNEVMDRPGAAKELAER